MMAKFFATYTLVVTTFAVVLLLSISNQAAPVTLRKSAVDNDSPIQRFFSGLDRELKRFSDLNQVIAEFTKPCRNLKNISLALANHCTNYVSTRVSRATAYGALSGQLAVDELWSLNNRTATFVDTIRHAFKIGGARGALKAFADIKDFFDMDELTLRQIAADLQSHVEQEFVEASENLQKRWPQDAEFIQDGEHMLRPELHETLRRVMRMLGLAEGPVTRKTKY